MTQKFCWIARHDAVWRNIFGDHAASAHNGVFADGDIRKDGRSGADRRALLNYGALDLPVGLGLQISVRCGRTRVAVVDEHHAMADKDVVFNGHAFTDEGVARYLAALADARVLLDFDERSNLGFVANFASIKIDELR